MVRYWSQIRRLPVMPPPSRRIQSWFVHRLVPRPCQWLPSLLLVIILKVGYSFSLLSRDLSHYLVICMNVYLHHLLTLNQNYACRRVKKNNQGPYLERRSFKTSTWCVSATPSSHGRPALLMPVQEDAPVPPSCPEITMCSALPWGTTKALTV